jgi:MYXO-CTERM domain-containing protein
VSSGGSSGTGTNEVCVSAPLGGSLCSSVQSCCDSSGCWYDADHRTFACDGHDCQAAAQKVASYCEPSSSSAGSSSSSSNETDQSSGCAISAGSRTSTQGFWLTLAAAVGLAGWRRRVRRR